MSKLADVLCRFDRSGTMAHAGAVQPRNEVVWKQLVSSSFDGFVKSLTREEVAMLSRFSKAVSDTGQHPQTVMRWAIEHWLSFTDGVRAAKGMTQVPQRPMVAYLYKHYDVALQLIADENMHSEKQSVKLTEVTTSFAPKPADNAATVDEAQAIINSALGL